MAPGLKRKNPAKSHLPGLSCRETAVSLTIVLSNQGVLRLTGGCAVRLADREILIEHITHDRRNVSAVACAFTDHADNDLRVVKGRKRDEQTVVERLAVLEHLGRTGLAANLDGVVRENAACGTALVGNLAHALHDKLARGIRNVDHAEHLGIIGFHKAAVIVAFDAFDERRLVQRAAVYDSGNIVCQLQRRKAVIRLTDRCVQIIAALPLADRRVGLALLLTIGRACCLTGGFADLDAGRRAETELLSPLLEVLTGQLLTDRVEECIARVFERIRDVERHGRIVRRTRRCRCR